MPDASNWTEPASELTSKRLPVKLWQWTWDVAAAELRRDRPEVVLERGLALVEGEADAAHEQRPDGELEPHATKIGSPGPVV
jgi:hypothetical protein